MKQCIIYLEIQEYDKNDAGVLHPTSNFRTKQIIVPNNKDFEEFVKELFVKCQQTT